MSDLHHLTIGEAAKLIETRKLSPVELTQAYLRRVEKLDAQINAFITLTGELALKQAHQAETEIVAGRYRAPMHGIPDRRGTGKGMVAWGAISPLLGGL